MQLLPEKISKRSIDPAFSRIHNTATDDAPEAYEPTENTYNECNKVVYKP